MLPAVARLLSVSWLSARPRSRRSSRLGLAATVAATMLFTSAADAAPSKLRGGLPLAFVRRPAADGSRRTLAPASSAAVAVRFATPPDADDLVDLVAAGAVVELGRGGRARGGRRFVLAEVDAAAAAAIAALPRVEAVTLDGAPFGSPPPLDYTAELIGAPEAWRTSVADGTSLAGQGVAVCDIDSGIDLFHPMFFRADGGYFPWVDVDGDGAFTRGVDGIDLDGDGAIEPLAVLDGVYEDWYGNPLEGSDDPELRAGWDWLYVDTNGNGRRDFGPDAGFVEADPAYGEPLFVVDDVDRDAELDVGERVVRLASSKLRSAKSGKKIYRRGDNLIDLPIDPAAVYHGTGAMSIVAGGQRGFARFVGIAPDADLVFISSAAFQNPLALTTFCVDEGASVVLHEYAPWVGYHLDGSSDLEQLIDEQSQQHVAHVNPVGNLSGADKMSERVVPSGGSLDIAIEAPADSYYAPFHLLAGSFLWRDTARDLAFTLTDPTGFSMALDLPGPTFGAWHDGLSFYVGREDSSRGTARVDVYVFGEQNAPPPIPLGTWTLGLTDAAPGSPDLHVLAIVEDDTSAWDRGLYFPVQPTEDYLIDFPSTADHAIGVAAYSGHGTYGPPGDRAPYSGRGHRFDGAPSLSVSAPDDPIAAAWDPNRPAIYANFGGTSGASPHVAGAAALLMQADPSGTGDGVRTALRAGALVDGFVGSVPNDDWGYGKLRVYEALYGEPPPGGGPPTITTEPVVAYLGEATAIPVELADPDEPTDGLLVDVDHDYDGAWDASFVGPHVTLAFDALGEHALRLRVRDATNREAGALAFVDVRPIEDKPEPEPSGAPADPEVEARGGVSCAVEAGERDLRLGVWVAAFLVAAALSRRRR